MHKEQIFKFCLLAITLKTQLKSAFSSQTFNSVDLTADKVYRSGESIDSSTWKSLPSNITADIVPYAHRDGDEIIKAKKQEQTQNLKFDAELIESADTKSANVQIEEQFRGNGLVMDRDNFYSENIEVPQFTNVEEESQSSHVILTTMLLIMATMSVIIYLGLVTWRSHLEKRYGSRNLLTSEAEDADSHSMESAYPSMIVCNHSYYALTQ